MPKTRMRAALWLSLVALFPLFEACSGNHTLHPGGMGGDCGGTGGCDQSVGGSGGQVFGEGGYRDDGGYRGEGGFTGVGGNLGEGGYQATGGQVNVNAGGNTGAGGEVQPNCAQASQSACELSPYCHAVYFDPHNCACAAAGCCATFHHCAYGPETQCYGGVACALAPPFCEGPYVIAYANGCYEGCVKQTECAAVCTFGADQTCNDNPIVSALHGRCTDSGTCLCSAGYILNPNTGRCL